MNICVEQITPFYTEWLSQQIVLLTLKPKHTKIFSTFIFFFVHFILCFCLKTNFFFPLNVRKRILLVMSVFWIDSHSIQKKTSFFCNLNLAKFFSITRKRCNESSFVKVRKGSRLSKSHILGKTKLILFIFILQQQVMGKRWISFCNWYWILSLKWF